MLTVLPGNLYPQVLNHSHHITKLRVGLCPNLCLRKPAQQENQRQTRCDDPKQYRPEVMHGSAPLQQSHSLATDALFPSLRTQAFVGGGLHTHGIGGNADR